MSFKKLANLNIIFLFIFVAAMFDTLLGGEELLGDKDSYENGGEFSDNDFDSEQNEEDPSAWEEEQGKKDKADSQKSSGESLNAEDESFLDSSMPYYEDSEQADSIPKGIEGIIIPRQVCIDYNPCQAPSRCVPYYNPSGPVMSYKCVCPDGYYNSSNTTCDTNFKASYSFDSGVYNFNNKQTTFTLVGSASDENYGIDSKAIKLNGNSYLQFRKTTQMVADFTVSLWVKPTHNETNTVILSQGTYSGSDIFQLGYYRTGQIYVVINGKHYYDTESMMMNRWQHFGVIFDHYKDASNNDKTAIKVYRNDKLIMTRTHSGKIDTSAGCKLAIGAEYNKSCTPSNYLKGYIDEVLIVPEVKSESWVVDKYRQHSPCKNVNCGSGKCYIKEGRPVAQCVKMEAYWDFESTSDKIHSYEYRQGTGGSISYSTTNKVHGRSMKLSNNAYAEIPAMLDNPQEFSMSMWVKPTHHGNQVFIARHRANDDNVFVLGFWNEKFLLNINGSGYNAPSVSFETNKWHHVALVVSKNSTGDKSIGKIYKDGNKIFDRTFPNLIRMEDGHPIVIGMDWDPNFKKNDFFNGYIDDLIFFPNVITESKIQQLAGMNGEKKCELDEAGNLIVGSNSESYLSYNSGMFSEKCGCTDYGYHLEYNDVAATYVCYPETLLVACNDNAPANATSIQAEVPIYWNSGQGVWSDPADCDWTCNSDYHKEDNSCESNTKTFQCSAPANATLENQQVEITWTGTGWTNPDCRWTCNPGYHTEDNQTCTSDYKDFDCISAGVQYPEHAAPVEKKVNLHWDGGWPDVPVCGWACVSGFHIPNENPNICVDDTKPAPCPNSAPVNGKLDADESTVTWNGSDWSAPLDCPWSCNAGYHKENDKCVFNTTKKLCTVPPEDAPANAYWVIGYVDTPWVNGAWQTKQCTDWRCNTGFRKQGDQCVNIANDSITLEAVFPLDNATVNSKPGTLSWKGTHSAGEKLFYSVYLVKSDLTETPLCSHTEKSSCPFDIPISGADFSWKVVAEDNYGNTAEATWSFDLTIDTSVVPEWNSKDTLMISSVTDSCITLGWNRPENSNATLQYRLEGKDNSQGLLRAFFRSSVGFKDLPIVISGSKRDFEICELEKNTNYTFTLKALNEPVDVESQIWGTAKAITVSYDFNGVEITEIPDQDIAEHTESMLDNVSFLFEGENAVQKGVKKDVITENRVAVIKGRLIAPRANNSQELSAEPLSGVTISIKDHPEFGYTYSRADGKFDMVVNGGGILSLIFEKDGHLSAQRQASTGWNEYTHLDDVAMKPMTTTKTELSLNGNTINHQLVESDETRDGRGNRKTSMVFDEGTEVVVTLQSGEKRVIDSNFNIKASATEYTTGSDGPAAMPAKLPPTTAYTFCSELALDFAPKDSNTEKLTKVEKIEFSKPVYVYEDNIINAPVGSVVPSGYYDREKAQWVPSENGLVIKLLSTDGGVAHLDVDGDGVEDTGEKLTHYKITPEELVKIAEIAQARQSDSQLTTFWRVPVRHFTPWDFNWPYGPPEDNCVPGDSDCPLDDPVGGDDPEEDDKKPKCEEEGSIIKCQNQVVGEKVDIPGTDFSLYYMSDRVKGRKVGRQLEIQLSGNYVPESLQSIIVKVEVAGSVKIKHFAKSTTFQGTYDGIEDVEFFPDLKNKKHKFFWDGLDSHGREVFGRVPVKIGIGYEYKLVYYASQAAQEKAFGATYNGKHFIEVDATGGNYMNKSVPDIIRWRRYETFLVNEYKEFSSGGLGGWTIDMHNEYDVEYKHLSKGNGAKSFIDDIPDYRLEFLEKLRGLNYPYGMAFSPDEITYIAIYGDTYWTSGKILRFLSDGTLETFADDSNALINTDVYRASGIDIGWDGSILFSDYSNRLVNKISPVGKVEVIAGTKTLGYNGDNILATKAHLNYPGGISISYNGDIYIADSSNNRIRKVSTDGIITTVAGNGQYGREGNGVSALEAKLYNPRDVKVSSDGSIFIADTTNNMIRKVTPSGVIENFAGTGHDEYNGDNKPAVEANIDNPRSIAITYDGSIIIADTSNYRIRKVNTKGIISTIAGTGKWSYNDEQGSNLDPTKTDLCSIGFVAVAPDKSIYFSDNCHGGRIGKLTRAFENNNADEISIKSKSSDELYIFTTYGQHLRTLDSTTGDTIYEFGYDEQTKLLKSITDRYGNVTSINRDDPEDVVITAPDGQETILNIVNGELKNITYPNTAETFHMEYYQGEKEGLIRTFTDPNNVTTTFEYDDDGRLVKDIYPYSKNEEGELLYAEKVLNLENTTTGQKNTFTSGEGVTKSFMTEKLENGSTKTTITFADQTSNQVVVEKDGSKTTSMADGSVYSTKLKSDPRFGMMAPLKDTTIEKGGLTKTIVNSTEVKPDERSDIWSFDTITETTSVNGKTSKTIYNKNDRKYTYVDPLGRENHQYLDNKGNISKIEVPGLHAVNMKYYSSGKLEELYVGEGDLMRKTSFKYNPDNGFLETVTKSLKNENGIVDVTTTYFYDPVGRKTREILPDNSVVDYGYDKNGNLISLTTPNYYIHQFIFSPLNLESEYTPPNLPGLQTKTSYIYNKDKKLTDIMRPDGTTVHYTYEYKSEGYGLNTGKLRKINIPSRGEILFTYHDDGGKKLKTIETPEKNKIGYAYNSGLVDSETFDGEVKGRLGRQYNNDFDLSGLTLGYSGSSTSIQYNYFDDGKIQSAGELEMTYREDNDFLTDTIIGNVATTQTINGFGELASFSADINEDVYFKTDFERDSFGRIINIVEKVHGKDPDTFEYKYSLAGQLVEVKKNGNITSEYSYDANGNRLTHKGQNDVVVQANITIDENGQQVQPYDKQDRLNSYGKYNYEYTANGDLEKKIIPAAGTTEKEETIYKYDEMGNLISVILPDGKKIDYIIDGKNRRIGKKVNGTIVKRWIYKDQLNPVAEVDDNGNVIQAFVYGTRPNVPDYIIKNDGKYRIISNHLGSPRLVIKVDAVDITKAVVQQIEYDEFGNVLSDTNPGFQPFYFAGGLYDKDTKLVRFGARDYDPYVGRWLSKDPIKFEGGLTTLYGYCRNDPVNITDSTGLYMPKLTYCRLVANECIVQEGGDECKESGLETGTFCQNEFKDCMLEQDLLKLAQYAFKYGLKSLGNQVLKK